MPKQKISKLTSAILKSGYYVLKALILLAMVAVLVFGAVKISRIYESLFNTTTISIVHDVALVIVLVKAYRVLYEYFKDQHVSMKYILEISFIAPAIEIVFAHGNQALQVNILFALFSLASLVVYLIFYDKLVYIESHDDTDTE